MGINMLNEDDYTRCPFCGDIRFKEEGICTERKVNNKKIKELVGTNRICMGCGKIIAKEQYGYA